MYVWMCVCSFCIVKMCLLSAMHLSRCVIFGQGALCMCVCVCVSSLFVGKWGFVHITQCEEFVTNGITGYYANLTRSVELKPWPGGHEALFVATSDRLPRPSVRHTDEPQSGRISCLWLLHPLLDDWGGDQWLPHIGLRAPLAMASVLLTWSGGVISSDSICSLFLP